MADEIITPATATQSSTQTDTTTLSSPYESAEHIFQRYKITLANAKRPDAQTFLSQYNYTDKRIDEGLLILQNASTLTAAQRKEKGEQLAASLERDNAYAGVRKNFLKTRTIAREAFSSDPSAFAALNLSGPTKTTVSGISKQADTFYANLLGTPAFVETMSYYGYTKEKLTAEQQLLQTLLDTSALHKQEYSEAVKATVTRDEALDALDAWMGKFYTVANVAFKEAPQMLKAFGL